MINSIFLILEFKVRYFWTTLQAGGRKIETKKSECNAFAHRFNLQIDLYAYETYARTVK